MLHNNITCKIKCRKCSNTHGSNAKDKDNRFDTGSISRELSNSVKFSKPTSDSVNPFRIRINIECCCWIITQCSNTCVIIPLQTGRFNYYYRWKSSSLTQSIVERSAKVIPETNRGFASVIEIRKTCYKF